MNKTKELSSFGVSAVALDSDFLELERLGGQIERLEIETDHGLEHSLKLLTRFSECAERVATGVQSMAMALNDSRARAEAAAQLVGKRALEIQARHEENQSLLAKFKVLGNSVAEVTSAVAKLKKSDFESASAKSLSELDVRLAALTEQACVLRDEARQSKRKSLEKNAHALGQSLEAARKKLGSFAGKAHSQLN